MGDSNSLASEDEFNITVKFSIDNMNEHENGRIFSTKFLSDNQID